MRRFNRLILLLIFVISVFTLSACDSEAAGDENGASLDAESENKEKDPYDEYIRSALESVNQDKQTAKDAALTNAPVSSADVPTVTPVINPADDFAVSSMESPDDPDDYSDVFTTPTPVPSQSDEDSPTPTEDPNATPTPTPAPATINGQKAEIGDTVSFGKYDWYVYKADGNVRYLVCAKVLTARRFSHDELYHWRAVEDGDLRYWLNHDFLEDSFSDTERKKMVDNSDANGKYMVSIPTRSEYSTLKDPTVKDPILSNVNNQNYWIRYNESTNVAGRKEACYSYNSGQNIGTKPVSSTCGVRPVIWVTVDKKKK